MDYAQRFAQIPDRRWRQAVLERRAIIKEMHEAGYGSVDIAKAAGKDHTTILHHLWAMGIDTRAYDAQERARVLAGQLAYKKQRAEIEKQMAPIRAEMARIKLERSRIAQKKREEVEKVKKEIIRLYKKGASLKEIAAKVGKNVPNVASLLRGTGYFKDNPMRRANRVVLQLTTMGDVVGMFGTIRSASAATGIDTATISRVISGTDTLAGGYRWKRVDAQDATKKKYPTS